MLPLPGLRFGQVGDDFYDMIEQLNRGGAFSRPIDAELLRIGHNLVWHGLEVDDEDYKRIIEEITFVTGGTSTS